MAAQSSFDVSTGADLQEVDNAVNQAMKEIAQRYDFKGTHCTIQLDRAKATLALEADDDFKKVQVAIQGEELRVSSPSKDVLQEVMAFLRGQDFGIELKFGNYRS